MKGLLLCFTGLFLSLDSAYAAAQQPVSNAQSKEIQMFALQKDGVPQQILGEVAFIDLESSVLVRSANSSNTLVLARLAGGQATLRYRQGESIRIVARLPKSVDPRQLQLQSFERKGSIRTAYFSRFHDQLGRELNTRSFHAQQQADGSWLLEPNKLGVGEYCFSPKFNNDNYCFGIDK